MKAATEQGRKQAGILESLVIILLSTDYTWGGEGR